MKVLRDPSHKSERLFWCSPGSVTMSVINKTSGTHQFIRKPERSPE